jgi:ammonium transporter, Amt family
MMQTGFAMLCAGSIRQKNVKNIMLKNLLDACGGAIGFYTVGYAFAYGHKGDPDQKTFIGNSYFALKDFDSWAGWFFQFAFAATAATIVAGTVAERCKMAAYLCYSVVLTGFVYPVVVHAVWSSNGFLSAFATDPFNGVGSIDFAGSGVVHLVGGTTALIAAIVLGPRKGRFYDEDGNPLETPHSFPPHSVALQVLGTFILWFGWYGFNPGSALIIDNAGSAAAASLAAVTTTLAGASGAVTCMFVDSIIDGMMTGETSYEITMAMNGALGGLVAVTAGCAVVEPYAAIIIGAIGGVVYLGFSKLLIKLRIDDAVDAGTCQTCCPVDCFCCRDDSLSAIVVLSSGTFWMWGLGRLGRWIFR